MARKLAFDYTFNKAARQITLNGNVNFKRLLLINNATANTVIYNVGDPALKATTVSYNPSSDKTTVTLNYDTTGMNNSDVLQIFTEEDGVEIKPVDTLLDPVSKFRVSEPNTLIDTDFEYGLQATKWETLERVNNIPGYYSIAGDTPLSNIADITTNGSRIVTVTTTSPHGLTTGIPIDVRGVDSVTAEGTFLVRKTTDYSFTYETRTVQPGSLSVSVSINTAYVTITTGRFYVQSQIPFDNSTSVDEGPVVTDGASASAITVTTPYKHGFKVDSPFYLTNTLSNTKVNFSANSISSSGNVEDRNFYSLDTGDFVPYEPFHVGNALRVIPSSAVDVTNDTLTIPNHGLVTGDPITYLGSSVGTSPTIATHGGTFPLSTGNLPIYNIGTGANAAAFFYVVVVDADTIKLCSHPKDAYNNQFIIGLENTGAGNLTFSLFNNRGYEFQSNIETIQTTANSSQIKVTLSAGKTNKSLSIFPERQITLSDTGIAGLDGVYVVRSFGSGSGIDVWRETDNFFIMEGPSNSDGSGLTLQSTSRTIQLNGTGSSTNNLIRTKNYEYTVSVGWNGTNTNITGVSGATLNLGSAIGRPVPLPLLGDGDLPTRVGSIVRFSSVDTLTGVTANTNYWISAVTATSITLSSTNPVISVTPVTLGGTVGQAAFKIFRSGVRVQMHDGASSWQNHIRVSIHDWCSITGKMFTRECITGNKIFVKNHGLTQGTPVMFVGAGSTFTGGTPPAESGNGTAIYYIAVANRDEFELAISETISGVGPYSSSVGSSLTLSGATIPNSWGGGIYQIHPGFTVSNFSVATGGAGGGRDRVLAAYANLPAYMSEKAEIILKTGNGSTIISGITPTPNTYASYQKYYARSLVNQGQTGAGEFSITLAENGSPVNFTTSTAAVSGTGNGGRFICCRIVENPYSNSFYLPNHGGVSGQRTVYTGSSSFCGALTPSGSQDTQSILPTGTGFPGPLFDYVTDITGVNWPRVSMTLTHSSTINGLTNNLRYYMVPITDDIFKVQEYSTAATVLPSGQPTVQFSIQANAAQANRTTAGPFGFINMKFSSTRVPNSNGNRIFLPIENQTLTEGDIVRYESNGGTEIASAYTGAPGLVNGNLFTVRNVSSFTPLSLGNVSTTIDHDADASILTLTNVTASMVKGNTLWTGGFLNERMFINEAGAGTYTINGQSVTLLANQIHVQRGYAGTTAKPIPAETTLFKVFGSFQLSVREVATPRTFSVAFGSASTSTDEWTLNGHGLRIGETVAISAAATGGRIDNTIIGVTNQPVGSASGAQLYYAIPTTDNTFQLAHSKAAAFAGFPIDIFNNGTAGNWTFIQYYDSVPLLAGAATGTHSLTNVASTGTIDGNYNASSVSDYKITFNPGINIPSRSITFIPDKSLDLKNGYFMYQNHGFTTGTRINYTKGNNTFEIGRSSGDQDPRPGYNALYDLQINAVEPAGTGTPVVPAGCVRYTFTNSPTTAPFNIVLNQSVNVRGVLVGGSSANGYNGTFKVFSSTKDSVTVINSTSTGGATTPSAFVAGTYYVIRRNLDMFQLAYTKEDAFAGKAIQNYSVTGGISSGHTLSTFGITGESLGNGLATIVARDIVVNGSSINSANGVLAASDRIGFANHGFTTGDRVIYQVWGNGKQITGLVSGRQYFVNNSINSVATGRGGSGTDAASRLNFFSLHNTWVGAYTNTDLVDILGVGTSTLHQFKVTNPTLRGTTFKGDWNATDQYSYGDVVLYRNNYYMSVTGATPPSATTFTANSNQEPVHPIDSGGSNPPSPNPRGSNLSGNANLNWMLLPPLPSYTTKFLAQYRGGDAVKLSNKLAVRSLYFAASGGTFPVIGATNATTGIFTITNHFLSTGDAVVYKTDVSGGNHVGTNGNYSEYPSGLTPQVPLGDMKANEIYYVNVIDNDNFTIHKSPSGAFQGGSTNSGGTQVVPSAAGTGSYHRFEKIEGSVFEMQVVAVNNDSDMIVTDPYPTRQITFNPQSTVTTVTGLNAPIVSVERDEIYIPNHGLNTGVKVYYSAGFGIGLPISGLSEGGTFYVIRINDDVIRLASSLENALLMTRIDIGSTGAGFNHYLVAATHAGSTYIRYQSNSQVVTDALDSNRIYYSGQTGANIRQGVIQALPFIYDTQMFVRPDCLNLHRSFDGGVEISAAKSPGVQITRQTRRYFRYQSGKGLQYSTGINFSPSIDVAEVTHDGTYATVTTRKPHKLTSSNRIIMEGVANASGTVITEYTNPANGLYFQVFDVLDEFRFRYQTNGIPSVPNRTPAGFPALFLYEWANSYVRAGMFDDQNGMFFEYDGNDLFCVRRNATAQMAGTVSCAFKSNAIVGSNTKFTKQLVVGDRVVIRGMTYKITAVDSDTSIHISPSYRGTTRSKIIMTKVRDLRVGRTTGTFLNYQQLNTDTWNIDKCDGNGVTGFKLDIHRQQMAYMDYSWYGAGKVRFGFKDQNGVVTYVHEFVHNNKENEAYLRSGNLPARYDIENGDNPTYAPSLYHWGASVIMDGKFEDDKAYLFTVASGSAGSDTIVVPGTLSGIPVPILSIRLAPSVDSSLVGPLGERDLVNRMILKMNSCGIVAQPISTVTATGAVSNRSDATSVRLILNGNLSQSAYFTNYGAPSLCQIIKHTGQAADSITGGVTVFEFRAAAGANTPQELSELVEMGNSIMGGDFVYPNGPDVLTLAVVTTVPAVTAVGSATGSTQITARLTWTESQA